MRNKFCEKSALRNESDVEQFFVISLLKDLGYKETNILTKHAISVPITIGKGLKRQCHIPDYQVQIWRKPIFIIEAKHPDRPIDKYIREAQDYAAVVNRGFIGNNPIQYVLATNGIKTKLAKVDENTVLLSLNFEDFVNGNNKYTKLQKYVSLNSLKNLLTITNRESFEFKTPDLMELKGVFKQAHDLIRRKQKIGPKKAFCEFTKLLFVKMNEDKAIQDKLDAKEDVSIDNFNFSVRKIEKTNENWINTLFMQYRDSLENLVGKGEKKGFFKEGRKINLNPSTIKAIVEMIQSFNLGNNIR